MSNNTQPRRRPKRRSGRQIVESILDAARAILVEQGFDKLTTNKIAERAGVSVGSVYQYFPNKQAVVAGLTQRINDAMLLRLREVMAAELSTTERLRSALDVLCSTSVADAELRRVLLLHVPRSWEHTGIVDAEREVLEVARGFARELAPDRSDTELEDWMHVIIFATRGAAQGALLYRPALLEEGRLTAILLDMFLAAKPEQSQGPSR